MTKEEINDKYTKALYERISLEKEIGNMINNWANGDSSLNALIVDDLLNRGYKRLEELKQIEKELLPLFKEQDNSIKR